MIAEKLLYCNVCRGDINIGQEYATFPNNKYSCRHVTCIPKPSKKPKFDVLPKRKIKGGPKRRRAGGHGYTGGDGFVDIP